VSAEVAVGVTVAMFIDGCGVFCLEVRFNFSKSSRDFSFNGDDTG
jgi:hypothetical protein